MRNNDASQQPAEEPQQAAPSLGRLLRAAREAEHWSIEEIAAELRIEPRFLAALEDERFADVGPPVFTKGYLKLYCGCLGLDFAQLLPLYRELIGEGEAPLRGRRSVERRETPSSARWGTIGLAVVVLAGLAVWLLSHSNSAAPVPAPDTTAEAAPARSGASASNAAAAPDASRNAAAAAVSEEGSESTERSQSVSEPPQNAISALQQALLRRDAAQGEASAAAAIPASRPSGAKADAGPAGTPAAGGAVFTKVLAPAADGASLPAAAQTRGGQTGLEIELQFQQDSWVEVTDARNQRLYYGLAKAGDESRVKGVPPLQVLLGNADGVTIEVAGHPYRYPQGSRSGKVARFTVTAQAQ